MKDGGTIRRKRIGGVMILAICIVLMLLVAYFVGRPLVKFVRDPDKFRGWVSAHGLWGDLAFVGMMVLQVVIAVIPGEPFEIGAGYAFGFWEGTLLCLIAIAIGSAVIYGLTHTFGVRFALLFFSQEKLESLSFLNNEKKVNTLLFALLFLPGTPKDLLSYAAGLTKIRFWHWIGIVCLARLPSLVTSTVGGNALGMQNYVFSIIVFGATLVLSGIGLLLYRSYCKRKKQKRE